MAAVYIHEDNKHRRGVCLIHLWEGNDIVKVCKNLIDARAYCNKQQFKIMAVYYN